MASAEVDESTPRILVVDDLEINRLVMRRALEAMDAVVIEAATGKDAVRMVAEQRFAVILLDVQMPGMDGFTVAEKVRAREESYRTPIVFVTAISTDFASVKKGYECGAADYLFKPFDIIALTSKVQLFLDLYVQEQALVRLLKEIRTLEGLLPICAGCKKMRDDDGEWQHLETYLTSKTPVELTHSFCPDCFEQQMADIKSGRASEQ